MCTYCDRVRNAINVTMNTSGVYWVGTSTRLKISYGNIRYTKLSRNNTFYSKTIPIGSFCAAKAIYDAQGMAGVNRKWHNTLPEAKDRGCNLTVIQDILIAFP